MGHTSSPGKFKKIEIISSIFSDQNAMRLEINYRGKKKVKNTNTWRLNNTLLNNQEIPEKNQRGNQKIPRDKWQWKHDDPKPMGYSKISSKREVYSNTILPQEIRKISNKQSNLTPKGTTERRTSKTRS